jgi:hypothetical protein
MIERYLRSVVWVSLLLVVLWLAARELDHKRDRLIPPDHPARLLGRWP